MTLHRVEGMVRNPLIADYRVESTVRLTLLVGRSLREAMEWAKSESGMGQVKVLTRPQQVHGYRPAQHIQVVVVGQGDYAIERELVDRGFRLRHV